MSLNIVPCIWLDGEAEEAADFYVRTFPAGRILAKSRFPEGIPNPSGRPPGSVLTVDFEVAGQRFTTLNGGPMFKLNPSVSLFFHVDTPEDVDRVTAALMEGGEALIPLGSYPWSDRYAWVKDRYGLSWQVMYGQRTPGGAAIAPCWMFTDAQHGRAEEAVQYFTSVFPKSLALRIERYADGEGPPGTVKHARFVLAGQEFIAMDSPIRHGFNFNEALSFQVRCADQAEVDRYWEALAVGGEHGQCGWLKDRFGFSWQVVPVAMGGWMATEDAAARDRAFQAMLQMNKLDIAELRRVSEGEG